VSAIDGHFENLLEDVRSRMSALAPELPKPRLVLVKK
jgi:hypothetical protein